MSKLHDERQKDLFRPVLDRIIDMKHPLVLLAEKIDWSFIDGRFRSVCHEGPGQPPVFVSVTELDPYPPQWSTPHSRRR